MFLPCRITPVTRASFAAHATGQIRLAKETFEARAVQALLLVGIVAAGAMADEDPAAGGFLRG